MNYIDKRQNELLRSLSKRVTFLQNDGIPVTTKAEYLERPNKNVDDLFIASDDHYHLYLWNGTALVEFGSVKYGKDFLDIEDTQYTELSPYTLIGGTPVFTITSQCT